MSQKKIPEAQLPPILRNRKPPSKKQTIPAYEAGTTTYDLYHNQNSPFLERKNTLANQEAKLTREEVQHLLKMLKDSGYLLALAHGETPYEKRKISVSPPSAEKPTFLSTRRLPENSTKLRQMIHLFFQQVLSRLNEDPTEIYGIVNEIVPLLKRHGIRIKIYDAFKMFPTYDAFEETLESLTFDDEIENFEFFCSALFGFYSQLQ